MSVQSAGTETVRDGRHPLLGFLAVLLALGSAHGATREIHPGDSFEAAVESLQPGDTLIVHEGTYADTGRLSISVRGTVQLPVLITGAEGEARPLITRPPSAAVQNTINVEGATYLTMRSLEISGNGGDGVNMSGGPSHITLEELEIHHVDVGVNFRSDMDHIAVRGCHIHDTGVDGGTGEGMYVGCNYATCVVRDSVIEGNWIHGTLAASQGDGIEVKVGSHSNVVRDNVIHDTRFPCILVYGTEGSPRNVIEGNAMWNCGDSGIQAAADAVIRNNLILESPANGFNSQDHQGVTPNNLEFVHNTVVGGNPCLRMSGWSDKQGLVFANNAVYCDSGSFAIGGLSGVAVAGNVVYPETPQIPRDGYVTGRSTAQDFVDAAGRNVYPSPDSPLIDVASPAHTVQLDFNGTTRAGTPDAGAYTWTVPENPGWSVGPGFKDGGGPPDPPPEPPPPPTNLRAR